MNIFKNTNFDFLRWRWHAIGLSSVIIIAGAVTLWTKGIPKGVEFAGGTVVIEQFEQPVSVQQVRSALDKTFPGGSQNLVVQTYGDTSSRQVMIRVPTVAGESGTELAAVAQQVEASLRQGGLPSFKQVGTEIVGPTVGQELTSKGIWATTLSLIGILGYIAFRYQLSFGVGAVVATIHDLIVTLAFLTFFRYDITLNVIAALLTMTGFSTNDTIVIFDRVRENLRSMRRDSLSHVINVAVNQTLGRTVITSGTALLSSIALFLFGGEVLRGFAFTMIVGIITGTYSTVFIAAAIVSFWRSSAPTRAAAHAPVPPGSGGGAPGQRVAGTASAMAAQQPQRKQKPQRKARAS